MKRTHVLGDSEEDKRCRRGVAKVVWLYWIGVALAGLLFLSGAESAYVSRLAASTFPSVAAVVAVASRPSFVGTYVAACLSWSALLMCASIFVIRGSHVIFPTETYKVKAVLLAALAFAGTLGFLFWVGPSSVSPGGGRGGGVLWLGAQSPVAGLGILGGLYGFSQLFFFVALKLAVQGRVARVFT